MTPASLTASHLRLVPPPPARPFSGDAAASSPAAPPDDEEAGDVAAPRDRARLAVVALDTLDLGVLVCDARLRRVLYVNAAGAAALRGLGAAADRVPVALRRALERGGGRPVRCGSGSATEAGMLVRVTPSPMLAPHLLLTLTPVGPARPGVAEALALTLGLSHRQGELLERVHAGCSTARIARELQLRPGTVRKYLAELYALLDVHSRAELTTVVGDLLQQPDSPAPGSGR